MKVYTGTVALKGFLGRMVVLSFIFVGLWLLIVGGATYLYFAMRWNAGLRISMKYLFFIEGR